MAPSRKYRCAYCNEAQKNPRAVTNHESKCLIRQQALERVGLRNSHRNADLIPEMPLHKRRRLQTSSPPRNHTSSSPGIGSSDEDAIDLEEDILSGSNDNEPTE